MLVAAGLGLQKFLIVQMHQDGTTGRHRRDGLCREKQTQKENGTSNERNNKGSEKCKSGNEDKVYVKIGGGSKEALISR